MSRNPKDVKKVSIICHVSKDVKCLDTMRFTHNEVSFEAKYK